MTESQNKLFILIGDNGVDRIEFIYWSFIKKNTVGKLVLL